MKVAYVGRHTILPAQERAVKELGFEIVEKIENLPTEQSALNTLLKQLKDRGVEGVLTVALPPNLLAALSSMFPVYVFDMKSTTFPSLEEAQKWASEKPDARTYLPGRPGEPVRAMEFVGINHITVTISIKKVWPTS